MLKNIYIKAKQTTVFGYFLAFLLTNVLLMTLAGIFYNGNFHFWIYPFSYLGAVYSVEGLPNTTASLIYSFDMALSALILFLLANHLRKDPRRNNHLKPILCFVCGSGALIAAASPDDTMHLFHVLGSTLLVSSLWIMATTYLIDAKEKIERIKYYALQFTLQIPIFAYATTFFLAIEPTEDVLQKPALLGLSIALLYSTYHLKTADNSTS